MAGNSAKQQWASLNKYFFSNTSLFVDVLFVEQVKTFVGQVKTFVGQVHFQSTWQLN